MKHCHEQYIETPMWRFICLQYQEWLKDQNKNANNTEDESVNIRFTWGDVVPRQGWQTYTKYMEPVVPPQDYLKKQNLNGGDNKDSWNDRSAKSNWPITFSLIKHGYE